MNNTLRKYLRRLTLFKKLRRVQFIIQLKIARYRNRDIVHFIHIGKTAGTSIKVALDYRKLTFTSGYVLVLNDHGFKINHVKDDEKVFFVVRDPLTRFVSGFYSRYRMGQPRIYNPWLPREKEAFELFSTPNQLGEALSSKDNKVRNGAVKAMKSIGHVYTSYWDWFINENYLLDRMDSIVWVGRQEQLSKDFKIFKNRFHLPDHVSLPESAMKRHSNRDSFDKNLCKLAAKSLKKCYK